VPKKNTAENGPSGTAETGITAGADPDNSTGNNPGTNPGVNPGVNPEVNAGAAVAVGSVRNLFIANTLAATLFSAVIMILYIFNVAAAPQLFGAWPIIFYAVYSVFVLRLLPGTGLHRKVSAKRILFTLCLAVFFTAGVFILRAMNVFSIKQTFSGTHSLVAAVLFLFLFLFSWILLSTDYKFLKSGTQESAGTRMQRGRFVRISLWMPYAFMAVYFILSGRSTDLVYCALLFLSLLSGVWIRYIFRRTGGTPWLSAAVFSVFYSLLVFI